MNKAFTLVEVLIFVVILTLFFIAAMTVLIASLRNMKISEHKILATRYAEEVVEWLKGEKEADWRSFISYAGSGGGTNYCFNDSELSWPESKLCSQYNGLQPPIYKREVNLIKSAIGGGSCSDWDCERVDISVTVSWQELGNRYQVPIKTTVNIWESTP